MKRVAIYGRLFDDKLSPYVQRVFDKLEAVGASLHIYEPFHQFLNDRINIQSDISLFDRKSGLKGEVDFLMSIGGDGTFLDSTTFIRDSQIPIVGVNTGRLGFLSGIALDEIDEAVDAIVAGAYTLDSRRLLKLETENKMFGDENFALNELTVHKKDTSSMITIHAYLDGNFLNSYWADGLIVATPTGSTAYSLSCGGPIVMPGSENFVITPVAPHNLNVRPIVIPDGGVLTLKVEGRGDYFMASLDSRSESMEGSTELVISRNNFEINLLRLASHNYLRTIRNKLNWGLDKRN